MWQAIVFGFLGGVLGANGFPHFTRGIRPAGAGRTAALGPRPRRLRADRAARYFST